MTSSKIEITFTASAELETKLKRLKGLLAHQHPNIQMGQLIEKICDLALCEWDPGKVGSIQKRHVGNLKGRTKKDFADIDQNKPIECTLARHMTGVSVGSQKKRGVGPLEKVRANQAQIRRQIFKRARGKCENFQSTFALEIDHITPQALGGSSEISNLRLLCRSCNQRAAIEAFGQMTMDAFL